MSMVKERTVDVVQSQPENATYEEIFRELTFEQMSVSRLQDFREGKTTPNDDIPDSVAGELIR